MAIPARLRVVTFKKVPIRFEFHRRRRRTTAAREKEHSPAAGHSVFTTKRKMLSYWLLLSFNFILIDCKNIFDSKRLGRISGFPFLIDRIVRR